MRGELSVIQNDAAGGVRKKVLWELLTNDVVSVDVLHDLILFHRQQDRFLEGQGVSLWWKVDCVTLVISRVGSLMPQVLYF